MWNILYGSCGNVSPKTSGVRRAVFPVLLRRIATYGAAAMVIVALSFVVLKQASDRVRFEEVYAENSVVSVSLPDGSTACLQPDSRITYPVNAGGGKNTRWT